jgi:hypothetical protein
VAKTYTVEYALPDNFNHEVTEFHDLLTSLDVAYTGESWDDDFEVTKEDWQMGIDKLKNLANLEAEEKQEIESALTKMNEPLPEIIEFMELLLNEADSKHEYLVLRFF